jgi:hypothetical protein
MLLLAGERLPWGRQAGLAAVGPDGQRHSISGLGRMAVGAAVYAACRSGVCFPACACICGHLDSVCREGWFPSRVTLQLRRSDGEQLHGGSASCELQVPGCLSGTAG